MSVCGDYVELHGMAEGTTPDSFDVAGTFYLRVHICTLFIS